jgi:ornithine cyclodeaminase
VHVFARTQESLRAFCKEQSQKLKIEVIPAATAADATAGADIVNVATRSPIPVLAGATLSPGIHINAVGVNRLDHRELDLEAVRRADLIVVDSLATARGESGDLLPAIEAGLVHWETLPELGRVLIGHHPGRQSDEQITLFESHGMALEDLYVALHVFRQLEPAG